MPNRQLRSLVASGGSPPVELELEPEPPAPLSGPSSRDGVQIPAWQAPSEHVVWSGFAGLGEHTPVVVSHVPVSWQSSEAGQTIGAAHEPVAALHDAMEKPHGGKRLSPLTCTGVGRSVSVSLPSWPLLFPPQAQTVPSDFSATVCARPAATAVTPLNPLTCTGVSRSVVVASPS